MAGRHPTYREGLQTHSCVPRMHVAVDLAREKKINPDPEQKRGISYRALGLDGEDTRWC